MDWNDARLLDGLCYDLVLGDYPRGVNRAFIQAMANGEPPYTDAEVEENNLIVNVNDLTHTRLCHDGRSQLNNGFMKTGNYFTARTDAGPKHKRSKWGAIVTKHVNRPMKRSVQYFERQRAKFGMLILHGISPGIWENEDAWCTMPIGIEDALIPSNTLLGFKNLPFYVIRRSFTGIELQQLTRKTKRSPGWNMNLVERCIKWVDKQTMDLRSNNWPEIWAPEKQQERVKQDGGWYLGDQVPTVDCFDIYAYEDNGEESGWIRRIILDSWGTPTQSGVGTYSIARSNSAIDKSFAKDDFLFSSKSRKVGMNWQQMIAYQFADLSAVFPARYHSIRSLGWLVYAACHLGNRMRCKFYESVFEALNMLFEVDSMDDAQRALRLDLVNRGFIDKSIRPVKAADRWQVNTQLVELGLRDNAQVISDNSSSFVQNQNYSQNKTEKTKFQVMAELQATTQLVSAALNQAYQYEVFEDREIFRRFMRPNSRDPEVRAARAGILREAPDIEKYLDSEAWDIEHERVMGGGNKTQEMQIASWLMENREKYDPEPQRMILREATLAVTDDAGKADMLVPESPKPSTSVHDANLAAAGMLMGLPTIFMDAVNHQEYAAALIGALQNQIQKMTQKGGVPTPDELNGMQNLAGMTIQGQNIKGNGISNHIKVIEQDKDSGPIAKRLNDVLGKLVNEIKGGAQRLQAQMQKAQQEQAQGNGHMDPKDQAKIQAIQTTAQVKAQNATQSNAQRTAQRAIQFEQKMKQDAERHALDIAKSKREHAATLAKTDLEAAANITRNRMSSTEE